MFTFSYYIVASTGVYTGVAMSRSPKKASEEASRIAWENLQEGDAKAQYCSGISVEGWTAWRGHKKIAEYMDI
jgi:hypothetical protein